MTTQQLRNQITVTNWSMTEELMSISYFRSHNNQSKNFHLILKPVDYLELLSSIGSIDDVDITTNSVIEGECTYSLADFVKNYNLSQWDALSIAIRHEMDVDADADLKHWELFIQDKALQ
jgi:hypothetical protein